MSSFIKIIDDGAKAAVFTKFASYFGLTTQSEDIVFSPKSTAQRMVAEKRGQASVEFISIWRSGIQFDWARQNTSIARKGLMLEYVDSTTKSQIVTAKAVPTIMNYDIWFWSRDLDKMMQATEAYLMWVHSHPNLILNYNGLYPMEMYMSFGPVVDETDFDIYEKGKFFVSRMPLKMDGWVLTLFNSKTVLKIILDVYLREGSPPNYVDTLLNEYIITTNETLVVPKYPED